MNPFAQHQFTNVHHHLHPTPRHASHSKHLVARTKTDTSCNIQCNVTLTHRFPVRGKTRAISSVSSSLHVAGLHQDPNHIRLCPHVPKALSMSKKSWSRCLCFCARRLQLCTLVIMLYMIDLTCHQQRQPCDPTISNAVFESFWRKTNACDARRQKANEGHRKGTLRPTKAPWKVQLWAPSRGSFQQVPTPR